MKEGGVETPHLHDISSNIGGYGASHRTRLQSAMEMEHEKAVQNVWGSTIILLSTERGDRPGTAINRHEYSCSERFARKTSLNEMQF